MGRSMGLPFDANTCFKRKNRWLLIIPDVSDDGINVLAPSKGARPSVSFKEIEAQHLNETIYFPGKPDWKPITLTLYDVKKNQHPVFEWIRRVYDPENGDYFGSLQNGFKINEVNLELYDGCGEKIESWIFESVYASSVEFGDLDMTSSEILTCEITLRYDRAYVVYGSGQTAISRSNIIRPGVPSPSNIIRPGVPSPFN